MTFKVQQGRVIRYRLFIEVLLVYSLACGLIFVSLPVALAINVGWAYVRHVRWTCVIIEMLVGRALFVNLSATCALSYSQYWLLSLCS